MRKILIGLLGYTFVSQQMVAQTDSIASTPIRDKIAISSM
mgnify:CR=1 FL=1